jgi:hypothetical protein
MKKAYASMIKIITYTCVFFLYLTTVFGQQSDPEFRVEPVVGNNAYDQDLGYNNSISYGLALNLLLFEDFKTGLKYKTSSTHRDFEIPGNNMLVNSQWHMIHAELIYDLLNINNFIFVSPSLGIGAIYFRSDPMIARLGALGTKAIPAQSSYHLSYSAGMNLRMYLFGSISLFVCPGAHFFNNSEGRFVNYYLDGGLSIAIR